MLPGAEGTPGVNDMPLRVLFIHPSYPNIFTRVVDALSQRPGISCSFLVENRCRAAVLASQPTIAFYGYDPSPGWHDDRSASPITFFESGVRRGTGVATAFQRLRHSRDFDVVVGSASNGCTMFLKAVADCAVVSHCEHPGFFIQAARPEFPRTLGQYVSDVSYRAMVQVSVSQSELGLVASNHARNLFPSELQSKVRVQSEGVPMHALPDDIPALKQRLGLPAEGPILGFFGRTLEAVRGFDIFLQVAARLRSAMPALNLLVIGSNDVLYGNEQRYLGGRSFKQHALEQADLPEADIIWRDFLPYDEFLAHLACLDLAVLPTFEGASNWSFFDAMSAAVPILSSRRSYIPELIEDGVDGVLLEPYDVDGFVAKAQALLSDPSALRTLGLNARERIRREHTPEHAAKGYEAAIREAYALNQAWVVGT
jgi:glycosyltransferase involved in cell wall biosynthesis